MTDHLHETEMAAYIDESASDAVRSTVAAHLAACPMCAAEVRRAVSLAARLSSVPRSIDPPRDPWPEIRGEIQRERRRRAARWMMGSALLAAAAVLLVMSVGRQARNPAPIAAQGSGALAEWRRVEPAYERSESEMAGTIAQGKTELTPTTVAAVQKSLATIDSAIAEARAALDRDPSNEALARLLVSAHERKVDLLARATRAMSGT